VLNLATSSITKYFSVTGDEQVEKFAAAIEESYQESFQREPGPDINVTYLRTPEEVKQFMRKRKTAYD